MFGNIDRYKNGNEFEPTSEQEAQISETYEDK